MPVFHPVLPIPRRTRPMSLFWSRAASVRVCRMGAKMPCGGSDSVLAISPAASPVSMALPPTECPANRADPAVPAVPVDAEPVVQAAVHAAADLAVAAFQAADAAVTAVAAVA